MTDTNRLGRLTVETIRGSDLLPTWSSQMGGEIGLSLAILLKWVMANGGIDQVLAKSEQALAQSAQALEQANAALVAAEIAVESFATDAEAEAFSALNPNNISISTEGM